MLKNKWLVDIAQEQRFNDTFAMIFILLTFKSFLVLLRHIVLEFLKILAIFALVRVF